MRKPNFLIVGAAKSGTTSLFEYLRGHPDVFMPDIKEASYFAGNGGRNEVEYLELFRKAGAARAVGEASVSYLYPSGTAAAIHDSLGPSTRIVIILRNPIDVAYSLWGHLVREGSEGLSFGAALEAEESRLTDPVFRRDTKTWLFNFAYVDRARYAQQVSAYLRAFGRAQVRVLIFEEFFADVAPAFADLCRFLDVSPAYRPEFQVFNQSGVVRSRRLQRFLGKPSRYKNFFSALTPHWLRQKLKAWLKALNYKNQRLPPLSNAERDRLWRSFEPDVAELEVLLGRRLDCWGPGPSKVRRAVRPVAESDAVGATGTGHAELDRAPESGEIRLHQFVPPLIDDTGE